jgi:hypothetical protein
MCLRQRAQAAFALLGETDPHDPVIGGVAEPLDKAGPGSPVDELHRAVVALQEMGGEIADAGRSAVASHRQEELMLRRCDAGLVGLLLTPAEEPPETVPEVEQSLEVLVRERQARGVR